MTIFITANLMPFTLATLEFVYDFFDTGKSKLPMLVKYGNFGQIWKFWSNMEMLVKYGNFGQIWKCWSNMEI